MSTIVSTLLLVVAAGIIGAFLVSWANSSFAVQQLNIANQTTSRINLVKEDLVVEDVWFYTDTGDGLKYANVTLRNTGDLAITIHRVYINYTQAWSTGETILIGDKEEIKVRTDWNSGSPYSVLVTTERGTQIDQVWKS